MWKQGSLTSSEVISSLLSKQKVPQLKSIAVQTGNMISGNKQQLIQRLVDHFEGGRHQEPSSVLSFDLGYRNLAYCHMNKEGEILDWARVDLMLPSFHPSVVAPIVRKFVRERIEINLEKVDQVVVELQRARSGGGIGIFEHTLRVNCVESLLWSGLYESVDRIQRPEIQMSAINPTAVDKLWKPEFEQLPIDHPELFKKMGSGTYFHKQVASVMVNQWLQTDTVIKCSDELKIMFESEKKKDDLSDSLIQALAWYKWNRFTNNYIEQYLLEEQVI